MTPRRRTRHLFSAAVPVVLAASLTLGQGVTAVAATTNSDQSALEVANAELSRSAANEGMVLLELSLIHI